MIILLFWCATAHAQIREYTSPGSYFFTVPAGVTTLQIVCIGGGGAGGNAIGLAKGGGGSGAYAVTKTITTFSGNQLEIIVGTGASTGTKHSSVYVPNVGTVAYASGGVNGNNSTSGIGSGGQPTTALFNACIGDTKFSPGAGGIAQSSNGSFRAGAGGGSAGSISSGAAPPADNSSGGGGGALYGGAGAIALLYDNNGLAGGNYGGGGSGASSTVSTSTKTGGVGGSGYVRISYNAKLGNFIPFFNTN